MSILLQINSVVNIGSTGRIAEDIGKIAINSGFKSFIAYGRDSRLSSSELIKIGNTWDIKRHGVETRLFDRHGLASNVATKKFIDQIRKLNPDIIHLHNLHGYYLNIKLLSEFLKDFKNPVVWTLHDCWPITGHCTHFDYASCEKWLNKCYHCPQKKEYPSSYFIDRSEKNYILKREVFSSISNLTLVPVSNWLGSIYKKSFLREKAITTINNGIDLNVFNPKTNIYEIKRKFGLDNRFTIIGVATAWSEKKGLNEFIRLAEYREWCVLLIGISSKIGKRLPPTIKVIPRTDSQNELAELYSIADVFVNPTYEDSFPTVNLESLACGTPVVTYKTGGSPESIDENTGIIVAKGDFETLVKAINQVYTNGKDHYNHACVSRAQLLYNKEDRYKNYIDLYDNLLSRVNLPEKNGNGNKN